MALFTNFYRCSRCGYECVDVWSATCEDDCPSCGSRHYTPYMSEDAPKDNITSHAANPYTAHPNTNRELRGLHQWQR